MAKDTLKVGSILLFNFPGRFWSKLMRWAYRIKFGKECVATHCAIVTEVNKDTIVVHEALINHGQVIESPYDKQAILNWEKEGIVTIRNAKVPLTDVKHYAEQYVGKPYGTWNLIYLALITAFGYKGTKTDGTNTLICTEDVARILYDSSDRKINFVTEYGKPYDSLLPMDLYNSAQLI